MTKKEWCFKVIYDPFYNMLLYLDMVILNISSSLNEFNIGGSSPNARKINSFL